MKQTKVPNKQGVSKKQQLGYFKRVKPTTVKQPRLASNRSQGRLLPGWLDNT